MFRTASKLQSFGSDYTLTYEFGHTEFTQAMAAAVLPLPFALSIIIDHDRPHPLYITVKYELNTQMITLADRQHITGVIAAEQSGSFITCVVGPGTVPSLALIPSGVTKISILVTRDGTFGSVTSDCKVALQFDDPYIPYGTAPLIGSSSALINDMALGEINVTGSPFGPGTTTVADADIPYPYRLTILSAVLECYPTPSYPGDIEIFLLADNKEIGMVSSDTYKYGRYSLENVLVGYCQGNLQCKIRNNNAAQAYKVNVRVLYGLHL